MGGWDWGKGGGGKGWWGVVGVEGARGCWSWTKSHCLCVVVDIGKTERWDWRRHEWKGGE